MIDLVSRVKPKVLMLDRYDMYNGTFNSSFADWARDSIILIDCKGYVETEICTDWCTIEMEPQKIEVIQ